MLQGYRLSRLVYGVLPRQYACCQHRCQACYDQNTDERSISARTFRLFDSLSERQNIYFFRRTENGSHILGNSASGYAGRLHIRIRNIWGYHRYAFRLSIDRKFVNDLCTGNSS